MKVRIPPAAIYPAGVPGVAARQLLLSTGLRVRVVESGPPDGRPVFLLHGWGACIYTFRFLIGALASAGRRVSAVDLRGHGLSEKPVGTGCYGTVSLLDDLRACLDALGLERSDIVAHSMGGGVALRFAIAEPERVGRLVLAAPVGLTKIRYQRVARLMTPAITDRLARFLVPRWVVSFLLHGAYGDPRRVRERDVDQYWAPTVFPEYYRAVRDLLAEFDWRPLARSAIARVRSPTLVILGCADRLIQGAEPMAAAIPTVAVRAIRGAGHLAIEEESGRVNDEIVRFLNENVPVAPSPATS